MAAQLLETGEPEGTRAGAGPSLARWFAAPSALFAAFVALPLLALIVRALGDGEIGARLTTPFVTHALVLSLVTSTLSLALSLLLGVPAAYLLARSRFPGYRFVTLLVELPMVLPPTVAGVALLVDFLTHGASWCDALAKLHAERGEA